MPDLIEPDEYATVVHRWWHLSTPSPELLRALADGWLGGRSVLDVGCGLGTEVGYLAMLGWSAVGVDLSSTALRRAADNDSGARFVTADALRLPFRAGSFDAVLDRGCFHYLPAGARRSYADELRRVLIPRGRMLLRACLTSEGVRNDVNGRVVRDAFGGWQVIDAVEEWIPSDTRSMPALVVRLEARDG